MMISIIVIIIIGSCIRIIRFVVNVVMFAVIIVRDWGSPSALPGCGWAPRGAGRPCVPMIEIHIITFKSLSMI